MKKMMRTNDDNEKPISIRNNGERKTSSSFSTLKRTNSISIQPSWYDGKEIKKFQTKLSASSGYFNCEVTGFLKALHTHQEGFCRAKTSTYQDVQEYD